MNIPSGLPAGVTTLKFEEAASAKGLEFILAPVEQVLLDRVNLRGSLEGDKRVGEEWNRFCNSIRMYGIETPCLGRKAYDDDGKLIPNRWILVDGAQRRAAAEKLGFSVIPLYVNDNIRTPADVMIAQTQCNIQRLSTNKAALEQHCIKLNEVCPNLTQTQLAEMLNVSVPWVSQTLKIKNLIPDVEQAMKDGILPLTHAKVMGKLPPEHQAEYLNKWLEGDKEDFIIRCHKEASNLKKAAKGEKVDEGPVFRLRSRGEIIEVFKSLSPMDVLYPGYQHVLKQDAESLAELEQDAEVRKLEQKRKASIKRQAELAKEEAELDAQIAAAKEAGDE